MKYASWLKDIDTESEYYGNGSKTSARLLQAKIPLVPGFVITKEAYFDFLLRNNLEYKIRQLLSTIAIDRPDSLMQGSFHIKNLFKNATLPVIFIDEVSRMRSELGSNVQIELIESGKHDKKYKKISALGSDNITDNILALWSEMFSSGALWKRHQMQLDHFEVGAELLFKAEIIGEKAGIITTIEPDTHDKDKIVITTTMPNRNDWYLLSKKNLTIVDRQVTFRPSEQKLTIYEISLLGNIAKKIDNFLYYPQIISWLFSGDNLYITDIKPVSTLIKQKVNKVNKLVISRGKGITSQISTGRIHFIHSMGMKSIGKHDMIIVSHLPASNVKYFKSTRGIIIESSGLSPETRILLKQFAIPSISNVKNASVQFKNGTIVTINGAKGEIYSGGFL